MWGDARDPGVVWAFGYPSFWPPQRKTYITPEHCFDLGAPWRWIQVCQDQRGCRSLPANPACSGGMCRTGDPGKNTGSDPSCELELQICKHSPKTRRGANALGHVGLRSRAEPVVLAWPSATYLPPAAFSSPPFPGLIFDKEGSLHPPALCIIGAAKGKAPFGAQINRCLI